MILSLFDEFPQVSTSVLHDVVTKCFNYQKWSYAVDCCAQKKRLAIAMSFLERYCKEGGYFFKPNCLR